MNKETLAKRFAPLKVLVVGDLVLDEYLIGQVSRLSRESPVPVLEQTRVEYVAGGAANPAVNLCSLGACGVLAGLVGQDDAAIQLKKLLDARHVGQDGIITDPQRPTTQKTRIVAEGAYVFAHHLARVDRLSRQPARGSIEVELCQRVAELIPQVDAVLVSDYRLGAITPAVADTIRQQARAHNILTAVDSQGNLGAFSGFDLLRCNAQEARQYLGRSLRADADFEQGVVELATSLEASMAVITRGAHGLTGFSQQTGVFHLPASNRSQVFDVTGAGDVFTAMMTLALTAGLDAKSAASWGNKAAGVAVKRLGNVAVTWDDL